MAVLGVILGVTYLSLTVVAGITIGICEWILTLDPAVSRPCPFVPYSLWSHKPTPEHQVRVLRLGQAALGWLVLAVVIAAVVYHVRMGTG